MDSGLQINLIMKIIGITLRNWKMTEWISVKKKLPSEGDIVVAWLTSHKEPACVKFTMDDYGQCWEELVSIDRYMSREDHISHWIPLPDPPSDEG